MKNLIAPSKSSVPLAVKLLFTAYVAVLVPVYWVNYGPTNFLYFCDMSLFLTLISLWSNNKLPVSMAAVGILIPQFFWCVDYIGELLGLPMTGMTGYMFNTANPFFLRGLSLYHGWLPFLLCYLVYKMGYDKRALAGWSMLAFVLCLIAYFLLPPAGAALANPNIPRNVNYVFGFNDAQPQSWMPQGLYFIIWMIALFVIAYLPAHHLLKRCCKHTHA